MKFVRAIAGYNHLWAVRDEAKEADELTILFRKWSNANYLLDFFLAHIDDLQGFFHVEKIRDAIKDFPYTEQLDELFHPLSLTDNRIHELTREKARHWDRERHASWLRIYAIRIEPNVYIITGGAIKLTAKMQDREHTQIELDKLNACRNYLQQKGVFDKDSFIDCYEED